MIRHAPLLACLPLAFSSVAQAAPGENAIVWEFESFESSLASASAAKKPLLIYFWSNGSNACAELYTNTMSDERVITAMQDFTCFSADTASTVGYELFQKFHVTTVPAILFVDREGAVNDAVIGTIGAEGFVAELARVREGRDTVAAFRQRAAAAPDDFEVQYALAVKLQDCGDQAGYDEVAGRIKAADPRGVHQVAARLLMEDLQKSIVEAAPRTDDGYDFEQADLSELERFVKKVKHDEVAFDGWTWMAAIERQREDNAAYRKAAMNAWPHIDGEKMRPFSNSVLDAFWEDREQLDRKEKKFLLTVTVRAAEEAEKYLAEREAEMVAAGGEGCASYAGCAEGEGCGGCGGGKAKLVLNRAEMADALARALYVAGKEREALVEAQRALALVPDHEAFTQRVAFLQKGR